MIRLLLALLALLPLAASTDGSSLSLYKISAGAQCLDGSPAPYYFRASKNASSTLWLFSLEGGGACYTQASCTSRSKGKLGSSKNMPASITGGAELSADPATNPDFYDANMVYVPYVSGDCHRGQNNVSSAATWGLYFTGHLNFQAIVNHVKTSTAPAAFAKAERVLLTGGSAGGIGTVYNADWLASFVSPSVVVKAAPKGGWFFGGDYPDQVAAGDAWAPPSLYSDFSAGRTTNHATQSTLISGLWKPLAPAGCVAAQAQGEEYKCSTVHVAYHYVKTPMFVMENMYDTNQISAQGLMPRAAGSTAQGHKYIQYFGRGMRNSTASLKDGDGIFLSSCYEHTQGLGVGGSTKIGGKNSGELLGDWFWERSSQGYAAAITRDTCDDANGDLPCNPTCGHAPGPSPGPSPGPAPAGSCEVALEKYCPMASYPSPWKCGKCSRAHTQQLQAAQCTVAEVTADCKARVA